jgi:hypothetical protein
MVAMWLRLLSCCVYACCASAATRAVWASVVGLWHDDVHVDVLTHRLFKGSLQLLRRYLSWATNGLASLQQPSSQSADDGKTKAKPKNGTNGKQAKNGAKASPGGWGGKGGQVTDLQLAALLGDLTQLRKQVLLSDPTFFATPNFSGLNSPCLILRV